MASLGLCSDVILLSRTWHITATGTRDPPQLQAAEHRTGVLLDGFSRSF